MLLLFSLSALAAPLLAPVHHDAEAWSETITVIADLDGGGFVRFELAVSNIGPGSAHGGCRLSVLRPGVPRWTAELALDHGQWSHDPGPPERLRMQGCVLEGGPITTISAEFPDGGLSLRIAAPLSETRPPHHRLETKKGDFYEERVLLPWARVEGELGQVGAPSPVSGMATIDHFRVTALPDEIARDWVRFRGLSPAGSVLFEGRTPPDGGPVQGWIWVEGEARPRALTALEIKGPEIAPAGASWQVRGAAGALQFRIETTAELRRYAPVEGHGLLTMVLKALVGNPVTYDHRATLWLDGQGELPGLFEVMARE